MSYFHEEQRFGAWVWVVVVLVSLIVFVTAAAIATRGAVARPQLLILPVVVFVLITALLTLSRLDVDVDDAGIHIAFHLLWPKRDIALPDVKRATATSYSPLLWGGFGVHYMFLKGWSFNTGGHEGVLIETAHGASVMIGSQRAKELAAAITKAQAARAGR